MATWVVFKKFTKRTNSVNFVLSNRMVQLEFKVNKVVFYLHVLSLIILLIILCKYPNSYYFKVKKGKACYEERAHNLLSKVKSIRDSDVYLHIKVISIKYSTR